MWLSCRLLPPSRAGVVREGLNVEVAVHHRPAGCPHALAACRVIRANTAGSPNQALHAFVGVVVVDAPWVLMAREEALCVLLVPQEASAIEPAPFNALIARQERVALTIWPTLMSRRLLLQVDAQRAPNLIPSRVEQARVRSVQQVFTLARQAIGAVSVDRGRIARIGHRCAYSAQPVASHPQ